MSISGVDTSSLYTNQVTSTSSTSAAGASATSSVQAT